MKRESQTIRQIQLQRLVQFSSVKIKRKSNHIFEKCKSGHKKSRRCQRDFYDIV